MAQAHESGNFLSRSIAGMVDHEEPAINSHVVVKSGVVYYKPPKNLFKVSIHAGIACICMNTPSRMVT